MSTLNLSKKFAVVTYQKAVLEYYNPEIVFESDDIEECELYETEENCCQGSTVVEKTDEGIFDYYSGEVFEMNTYK